ncbi:MAG TPA: alpha-amylase family protein [Anaerolineales bacterium]|nr:alpha-amylase family protein [Anaerolineales bacterium]
MERGVYFDAWFPNQHCYHPSLPGRRLRMIDHLVEYRATTLVWAAMGGGSISLPYLEEEAFAPIDPRFRFYGFVNDSEFVKECQKHGIKVFGIVFEVQGWEMPAELNEDETEILSFNELRGVGQRAWMGLREFSQNRYPNLWPPIEKYFPDGLFDSDGNQVTDLIENCVSRDIHGVPCHARWVECPDREHQCYLMDRNNPVWREYLKAIIRVQIDAGVDGIQLDEAELPITSFQYGGCFCRDCMKGFQQYLKDLSEDQRPSELKGVDLDTFHYGEWLLAQGYDFKTERESTPLFFEYHRYQTRQIARYFSELADYARQYAAEKGRNVLVSGNFFNLVAHWYYAMEPKVDLIITEMRNTRYRQPAWYRYVAGFAAGKPVIVAENPYGGVIPDLVQMLKVGKGYDLFRMSLYEAAALGANMSVPYGAWMGSVIQDSFNPPHELCVEIQRFLANHEHLFSHRTASETAIVYSVETEFQRESGRGIFADNRYNVETSEIGPFWQACEALSDAVQPYDVIFFPDGDLRPDTLTHDSLSQYRTLILPDCRYLTEAQSQVLNDYVKRDGRLLVMGELGANLSARQRDAILTHPGTRQVEVGAAFDLNWLPFGQQAQLSIPADIAINLQRVEQGVAVHIIRYDYDSQQDQVPGIDELNIDLRLPDSFNSLEVFSPGEILQAELEMSGDSPRIALQNLPLYSIILLKE